MCNPEAIEAFKQFLVQLHLCVHGELSLCILNIMKVIHHASSDESNGAALGALIEHIIPFLGLSFPEGTAETGKAFTRRATPIEINNQIVHILYNLCSLNAGRALVAAQNGFVPIIKQSMVEDWPMRELILPVLFNMLRASKGAVCPILWKHDILPEVIKLLSDQSWCADACGCLGIWLSSDSEKNVIKDLLKPDNVTLIKSLLSIHRESTNFPKILGTYTNLAQSDNELATALVNKGAVEDVLNAFLHEKKSFTRVALMRLLLALFKNADISKTDISVIRGCSDLIKKAIAHDTSALVKNISKEIISIIDKHIASLSSSSSSEQPKP